MHPRRCELSTPGHDLSMIEKASESEADVVLLDLEDSVPPAGKSEARDVAISGVKKFDWTGKLVGVRVNAPDTRWAHGDVIEIVRGCGARLDLLFIPKAETPADLHFVDRLLGGLEADLGLEEPIPLEVIVETARAMRNVDELAGATDRLRALIFGPADYRASMGIPMEEAGGGGDRDYDPSRQYALNRLISSARAHDLFAIDGPCFELHDEEEIREEARRAKRCGVDGKWVIHPRQIAITNDVFTPGRDEVEHAREIMRAYEEASRNERGAMELDSRMIDAAMVREAERVLARARAGGAI